MMKIELKYGLITGLCISLWVLVEFFFGLHDKYIEIGQFTGYLSTIIPILLIYFGLREKRDREFDGDLTIRQGVTTGLVISFISAVVTTLFFLLYYHVINPEWRQMAEEFEREQWAVSGAGDAEIDRQLEQLRFLNSDTGMLISNLFSSTMLGLIISFLFTLVLRNKSDSEKEKILE